MPIQAPSEIFNDTVSAPTDGEWYTLTETPPRDHVVAVVSIKSGAASVVIEGRNSPNDTPVPSAAQSTSNGLTLLCYRQWRARVTAVTTAPAEVVVSLPYICRK